ncbi:hypothetical protein [Legionella spiritensis]|uniref:Uncharacterized protein n=1 Tax=Legionella spiritensis TaxID=452 RepID=A0A0W0ZA09_LEGSP|nr:hypothetical protein [Legionella spiritensis]KTD65887.1 hypothetical protein Lspi_0306 [Legionella spiritensis]SNV32033.1 Uncharacterised protein [Legionella spiritensis]
MARAPATAIKLDSSTALGQAFSVVKDSLPNPVSPDYLHISTTFVEKLAGNQANMSPQQEAIYKSIINEAAQKMRDIKSFKTGKINVTANGYVTLEIDSPEMKKIIETMQSKLNSHGFVTKDKANPIHVTLQKGTFPAPKPEEIAALKKAIQSPEIQALSHRDYSVSNAKFGAVEYSGNRVDMKSGWNK